MVSCHVCNYVYDTYHRAMNTSLSLSLSGLTLAHAKP